MAGDWIKMRTNLRDDPAVIGIADRLEIEEDLVVGKLHRLWSWADGQTTDGAALNVTAKWIDRFLQCPGFSKAMIEVQWLLATDSGVTFPAFEKHNGVTAKRRADASRRVSAHRSRNKDVTGSCYTKATVSRTLRTNLFDRDGGTCVYCGRQHGEMLPNETKNDALMTLDHVVPESRGGDTTADNLVTCCNSCNNKKGDRTPDEAGMKWPVSVTGKRYGCVTESLPEKRREEKSNKEQPTVVCPEPQRGATGPAFEGGKTPEANVIMVFPCVGSGSTEWPLTDAKVREYQQSFPAVDVLGECRKARQWCIDNSSRRKTFKGMPAFLSYWLGKEQDRGRTQTGLQGRRGGEDHSKIGDGEADLRAAGIIP